MDVYISHEVFTSLYQLDYGLFCTEFGCVCILAGFGGFGQ